MRRADDVRQAEERAFGCGLDFEDVEACAGDLAGLERVCKRSPRSTRPPRAQLMMRTPFFILAIASAT
jgi:hypothetical protein